ncbi:MAG: hypothetical protein L3J43_09065 [Sulfurovum sp.]|nr:hypothetical protein [Sulfurovum sp.]
MQFKNVEWHNYQGAYLPKTSPHINITLLKNDARVLLKKSRTLFLRYTDEWDRNEESEFWYVVKDKFKDMEELSGNTKSKVRRGLKHCVVKKVMCQEIATKGYATYKNAFDGYHTHLKPMSQKVFHDNIVKTSTYDFFAVYEKESEKMIAYSSNIIDGDVCNYTTIKFHPKYLKLYPSYALFYEMNKYYLKDKGFRYVHDGARSISHDTNIHTFLVQKFKFRKAYCRLHVVYRVEVKLAVMVLYPFRNILKFFNHSFINKISALLKQEEIRRSFAT